MSLEFTSVTIHTDDPIFNEGVKKRYSISKCLKVWNNDINRFMKVQDTGSVQLRINGKYKHPSVTRLALFSWKPELTPGNPSEYHADHIDTEGPHHLDNLQWLSASEHARKTMREMKGKRKSQAEKRGKKVMIIEVKGDVPISLVGTVYESCGAAAVACNVDHGNISRSARKGHWCGNFQFEFVNDFQEIPGEKWVDFHGYGVSNKGLIQMKTGVVTNGSPLMYRRRGRFTTIYSYVRLIIDGKSSTWSVHRLVWSAFEGEIPKGLCVLHDDKNPFARDGNNRQRNWLCDLSLGTPSENSQSYHDNKAEHTLKRVRCVEDGNTYRSASDAAKKTGIVRSSISKAARKKLKTAGGKTWEYV